MQRRRKYKIEEMMAKIPVKVYLLDCLFDGEDLTLKPYPYRIERLEAICDRTEVFKPVERLLTSDADELEDFFQQSIADGTEGLIVKSTTDESIYSCLRVSEKEAVLVIVNLSDQPVQDFWLAKDSSGLTAGTYQLAPVLGEGSFEPIDVNEQGGLFHFIGRVQIPAYGVIVLQLQKVIP